MRPEIFTFDPTVYVFDRDYHIMIPMEAPALVWVRVGDRKFYDHFAGVLRSDTKVHRVIVPQALLDEQKEYTVCWRKVIDRTPYFPQSEEPREYTVSFRPIEGVNANFYHVSDVHDDIDYAIKTAPFMERIDGLILNGDVPNSCAVEKGGTDILELTGTVGKGEIPVIFARGNHDARGAFAEHFGDYTPHREGRTYFTFRLGNIWGLVLDCGEDKPDTNDEYFGTICFHEFRLAEDAFVQDVVARAKEEYLAEGIEYRVVVCHHPISLVSRPPFDIEQEIYGGWCRILSEEIKPDLMISGHTHKPGLYLPGGILDQLGQTWPIGIGGRPARKRSEGFIAAGYEFSEEGVRFTLADESCRVIEEHQIENH
ncbi:MAG: metallophosphoesterase [Clostridia bacterium]|nr:metallophosphoesterase [Clostridia bacterium]